MAPAQIPTDQATRKIEAAATTLHIGDNCNCGWYGFASSSCPHVAFEVQVKCGLTRSEKTGRPIFCMKGAPHVVLPGPVIPQQCKEKCDFPANTEANNSNGK